MATIAQMRGGRTLRRSMHTVHASTILKESPRKSISVQSGCNGIGAATVRALMEELQEALLCGSYTPTDIRPHYLLVLMLTNASHNHRGFRSRTVTLTIKISTRWTGHTRGKTNTNRQTPNAKAHCVGDTGTTGRHHLTRRAPHRPAPRPRARSSPCEASLRSASSVVCGEDRSEDKNRVAHELSTSWSSTTGSRAPAATSTRPPRGTVRRERGATSSV